MDEEAACQSKVIKPVAKEAVNKGRSKTFGSAMAASIRRELVRSSINLREVSILLKEVENHETEIDSVREDICFVKEFKT